MAQKLKRLPAMQETWVRPLGWEDPLEKEMATCSSILAWKIAWMEEGAWRATVHGVPKSQTHTHTDIDQIRSVAQSCPTLCDHMNRSTPGLPVQHQLPEFTETHVHRVSDAIQPSHPLSSPSPPAPNPSQHQSLFQ